MNKIDVLRVAEMFVTVKSTGYKFFHIIKRIYVWMNENKYGFR